MAELRLRTVLRIKNVSANHPAHELTVPTSLGIHFRADDPTGPLPKPERVQPRALARELLFGPNPLLGYSSALNRLSSAFTCW
jgi:hypothetical protein